LRLTDKMYIEGDQGDRPLLGANYQQLSTTVNGVTDHAFGRAFDIGAVGMSKEQGIKLGMNTGKVATKQEYIMALDILLSQLQTVPHDLHPDLITISQDLRAEMGITEGPEGLSTPIRKKYPGLAPHVNFYADAAHRNHIHISFGPQRAGSFISPEIAAEIVGGPSVSTGAAGAAASVDKFKKSYKDDLNTVFTVDEIYNVLVGSGIWDEETAALFACIAERESPRPGGLNENKDNGDGDFSFGFFQCNLLPGAHGRKTFYLISPTEDNVLGFKLAYSIDDDSDPSSLEKKVLELANRSTTDPRLFIPYNQAFSLAYVANAPVTASKNIKNKTKIKLTSDMFRPWGGYKKSSVVWCFGYLKYKTAIDTYTQNSGFPKTRFDSWLLKTFKGQVSNGVLIDPYLDRWIDGEVFKWDGTTV